MHLLKVLLLLCLTLAAMRVASWLFGWLCHRFAGRSRLASTLLGNLLGLVLFVVLQFWNLMPGEPVDLAAMVFGVVVFGVYQMVDLKWCLWDKRRKE